MTVAPMPTTQMPTTQRASLSMSAVPKPVGSNLRSGQGLTGTRARARAPTRWTIARRRWTVGIVKRLLPLAAVALLVCIAMWPQVSGQNDGARFSYRRGVLDAENGQITSPRYRGVDQRNRPYTMTATTARQVAPERINLVNPKGDLTLENGNWLMVQSKQGVYLQKTEQLDLSGEVNMYRDDGTVLQTSSASVDLKAGAAAGSEMTHVEGPFGTLDAQGFALTDRGAVIQFPGPGHLVLNSSRK